MSTVTCSSNVLLLYDSVSNFAGIWLLVLSHPFFFRVLLFYSSIPIFFISNPPQGKCYMISFISFRGDISWWEKFLFAIIWSHQHVAMTTCAISRVEMEYIVLDHWLHIFWKIYFWFDVVYDSPKWKVTQISRRKDSTNNIPKIEQWPFALWVLSFRTSVVA